MPNGPTAPTRPAFTPANSTVGVQSPGGPSAGSSGRPGAGATPRRSPRRSERLRVRPGRVCSAGSERQDHPLKGGMRCDAIEALLRVRHHALLSGHALRRSPRVAQLTPGRRAMPAWRGHRRRDLGAHQGDRVAAPCRQPLDDADILPTRGLGEYAADQLIENDRVDDVAVVCVRQLNGDAAGGQRTRVQLRLHGVLGAQHPDARSAVAGGLVADDLGDVQARDREVGSWHLEGNVSGVVRAHEEDSTRAGEPLHASAQGGPDRGVVPCLPRGHAEAEGDAVQGHVRMFVTAQPAEPLLAEGEKAKRGAFGAVGENAKVLHDGSGGPRMQWLQSCTLRTAMSCPRGLGWYELQPRRSRTLSSRWCVVRRYLLWTVLRSWCNS